MEIMECVVMYISGDERYEYEGYERFKDVTQ